MCDQVDEKEEEEKKQRSTVDTLKTNKQTNKYKNSNKTPNKTYMKTEPNQTESEFINKRTAYYDKIALQQLPGIVHKKSQEFSLR